MPSLDQPSRLIRIVTIQFDLLTQDVVDLHLRVHAGIALTDGEEPRLELLGHNRRLGFLLDGLTQGPDYSWIKWQVLPPFSSWKAR